MQRSPAAVVGAVRVGAAREQLLHHRLVAAAADGVGCEPEQVVAVRAARTDESRVAVEQLAERFAVARLDRAERPPEGLAALGQVVDVATERRPAREAVLPCEHEPRCARAQSADLGVARVRERRVVGAHDRDPARQAALHDAAQALGAVLVVADVIDERVRQGRAVRRDAVDVGLELRPAGKPVLARERELRIAQAQRLAAGPALAHELLGLFAQLLQARGCGQWRGHAASSPARPSSACPGGKKDPAPSCTVERGWARPFPRTGRGPDRAEPRRRRNARCQVSTLAGCL